VAIRDTLRGTKGVVNADVVTGPYDIVAVLESGASEDIYNNIIKKIRRLKGINRTETFIAME
jgi:DNA-binding Lrp family transcriptional regulator